MAPDSQSTGRTLFLNPCTIFAHGEEHLVTTILGSCVAVCLHDPVRGVGGINHYMLPLWNGEGLPTPKYGNVAIDKLLERMVHLGSRQDCLVAKVFGGAGVLGQHSGFFSIGERNVSLARKILDQRGIAIAAAEVGGERGLKILFNTHTGTVLVSRIKNGNFSILPDGRPPESRS